MKKMDPPRRDREEKRTIAPHDVRQGVIKSVQGERERRWLGKGNRKNKSRSVSTRLRTARCGKAALKKEAERLPGKSDHGVQEKKKFLQGTGETLQEQAGAEAEPAFPVIEEKQNREEKEEI